MTRPVVPGGADSSTLNRSGILIREAGGSARQGPRGSPGPGGAGAPWRPSCSQARGGGLGFPLSGSACSAFPVLAQVKSAPECARRSVPGGSLTHSGNQGSEVPPPPLFGRGQRTYTGRGGRCRQAPAASRFRLHPLARLPQTLRASSLRSHRTCPRLGLRQAPGFHSSRSFLQIISTIVSLGMSVPLRATLLST